MMEITRLSLLCSLSLICFMVNLVKSELSNDDCLALGYNRASVSCSSCDLLEKFELSDFKPDCLKCCNAEKSERKPIKKYPKARLEVCECKFGALPQIQAFVKSNTRQTRFPNLQYKHVGGKMPEIKLIDESGTVAETLSITKWDTDTIEEFLNTYLEHPDDTKSNENYI